MDSRMKNYTVRKTKSFNNPSPKKGNYASTVQNTDLSTHTHSLKSSEMDNLNVDSTFNDDHDSELEQLMKSTAPDDSLIVQKFLSFLNLSEARNIKLKNDFVELQQDYEELAKDCEMHADK